ncbi:MAG: hypothetical protein FVQ80_03095 [Planctomycetes bacterium]|nr:hypothetical protein [Planctomycetota bacterium]
MKWSKILVLLLVVLACSFTYAGSENTAIPTEEQVQKLVAATWKKPIKSIHITFYKDSTKVPEPIEQIRKRAEEFVDSKLMSRSIGELKPYEIERRNKIIEANFKNWVENQKFPRKAKCQVWISGNNQRIDTVTVGPNKPLGPNTPFVHTFINTKDANTGDFVSYHYASEMNTVFVNTGKWAKEDIAQFAGMPFRTALFLRLFLGMDQGSTPKSLNYIPDPNKMAELARTGLASIEPMKGTKSKGNKAANKISIRPNPNTPDTRDIIEMGDPNHFPAVVLICDRRDYSRVYRTEFHIPKTNKIRYIRECDSFNSQGFPHNITEIQYDKDGNFVEKSVYRIIKVELNPSIPAEIFEFHPPQGYRVVDHRSKKP